MNRNSLKRLLFMFMPLFVLGALCEAAARIFTSNRAELVAGGLGAQNNTSEPDVDLGWRLVPNSVREKDGWTIRINSTGQRSPEVDPRTPGDFRILSLGESTTFGVSVPQHATYSARLEAILNEPGNQSVSVSVINAGVSAYSSFQSLRYLELYGHSFQPDAVLFYHEVNDYLPTAIRGGPRMGEIGLLKTDKELYGSRLYRLEARMMELSHFYGWISRFIARRRIEELSRSKHENPLWDIRLPDLNPARIAEVNEDPHGAAASIVRSDLRASAVGQRVSQAERLEILEELASWCAERKIQLVLIHPSYRDSVRHECVLTQFASEHGVLMFEAYDRLHPDGAGAGAGVPEMFTDSWHPTAAGHEALAQGLAQFFREELLKR